MLPLIILTVFIQALLVQPALYANGAISEENENQQLAKVQAISKELSGPVIFMLKAQMQLEDIAQSARNSNKVKDAALTELTKSYEEYGYPHDNHPIISFIKRQRVMVNDARLNLLGVLQKSASKTELPSQKQSILDKFTKIMSDMTIDYTAGLCPEETFNRATKIYQEVSQNPF